MLSIIHKIILHNGLVRRRLILETIIATIIFIAMFVFIVMDKIERQYVTLGCGVLTLVVVFGICMHSMTAVTKTLNFASIFTLDFWHVSGNAVESSSGINWATIIFITGMMIMVEGLSMAGFFRWLCMELAKLVKYKTIPIFIMFMCVSFVLSMFIDSITVILFLAAVTIELARLLKFNPVPMILSEIFCANLGGSATMCGDPPNIIIGTSLGYSFGDFVSNTGLLSIISLIFIVLYFFLVFRKEYAQNGENTIDISSLPTPGSAITSKKDFVLNTIIFFLAVILLVSHANTGLTVAFIGVVIALLTLLVAWKKAWKLLKGVDYKTLLFFIGLFVVVGGLEQTGALEVAANAISVVSGGNVYIMVAIIIWGSAIASAFIDNIPFAATMIPVIKALAATHGVGLNVLAWALAMGTDIGGSATPIGASANVVGTSIAAKAGHPVGWGEYCKKVVPATILVVLISTIYIFVRYM